jgi:hypothetical protein
MGLVHRRCVPVLEKKKEREEEEATLHVAQRMRTTLEMSFWQ